MLDPLCQAAENGELTELRRLLAAGHDANKACGNFGALYHAIRVLPHQKQKDVSGCVRALVEAGAEIDRAWDGGETAFFTACAEGRPDVVRYFIERGANICAALETGFNSLHLIAAEAGGRPLNARLTTTVDGVRRTIVDPEEIKSILGSHPDAEYAAYLEIVGLLIKGGIEVDALDRNRQSALFQAAGSGSPDIIAMLLEAGANPNLKDRWGLSALHYASRNGHSHAMDTLIKGQADVNARDSAGFTPLHEAAEHGHVTALSILLAAKADPDATLGEDFGAFKRGMSALDVARSRGQTRAAALLERRSGSQSGTPPAQPAQSQNPLNPSEARKIADALMKGRSWQRRGRAGHGLSFAGGRFFHSSYDEDREERFGFESEESFLQFLCRLDLKTGSYSYLRQDFGL